MKKKLLALLPLSGLVILASCEIITPNNPTLPSIRTSNTAPLEPSNSQPTIGNSVIPSEATTPSTEVTTKPSIPSEATTPSTGTTKPSVPTEATTTPSTGTTKPSVPTEATTPSTGTTKPSVPTEATTPSTGTTKPSIPTEATTTPSTGTTKPSTGTSTIVPSETTKPVESSKENPTTSPIIPNNYKVKYMIDNTLYNEVDVVENKKLEEIEAPAITGYTFLYWSKDKATEFNLETPITEDTTLYAVFKEISYSITYYCDGENPNQLTSYTITDTITLLDAIKDGYEFLGWYLNDDDDLKVTEITNSTGDLVLYAKFKEIEVTTPDNLINSYGGYNEGIYFELNKIASSQAKNYVVKYKNTSSSTYTTLDNELIRVNGNMVRIDIIGLTKGTYDVEISTTGLDANYVKKINNINVTDYDRSGYAHFNTTEAIGAYNNDGTLKSNATVVYVTEETKNTITATIAGKSYKGISAILQAQRNSKTPLNIRILGTIGAATWNKIDYKVTSNTQITPADVYGANGKYLELKSYSEDDLIAAGYNTLNETEYKKLNGLTNKIKYDSSKKEFDSYYNMLDIQNATNVTVEGIGNDAMLFQWGFTWKNCSNIEVRNLTFDDNTEDACSFEGEDTSAQKITDFKTGHIWLHNNNFNEGINYWDVCNEQDKHEGDGATDFKGQAYITISYNHYYKNHKTGLIGGSDSQGTACVTFHHNYYEKNTSRLPLGRGANMHMYNNYYYGSTGTNMSLRAGAYALIEGCYFENDSNPMEIKKGTGVNGKSLNAAIKLYDSKVVNCKGSNGATVVENRTDTVANDNVYASDFDTNSSVFYYDSTNKRSKVSYLTSPDVAKADCIKYAGAQKNSNAISGGTIDGEKPITSYTVQFKNTDDSLITSVKVTENNNVTKPTTPTKTGYNFVGWYTSIDLKNEFDFNTKITENTTIYAKWEEIKSEPSNPSEPTNTNIITFDSIPKGTTSGTFDNITLITGSKTATIKQGEKQLTDTLTVNQYVAFSGQGSTTNAALKLTLTKATTITIYYNHSNTSATRYLVVSDGTKDNKDSVGSVNGELRAYTLTLTEGTYYLYSANSSLNVYAILIN